MIYPRQEKNAFKPKQNMLIYTSVAVIGMTVMVSQVHAQLAPQAAPKTTPQDPNSTQSDTRPGETLSERLDRTNGVIKPPANTDPGIAVQPPVPEPNSTPVIQPPGTPGGDQNIQPK